MKRSEQVARQLERYGTTVTVRPKNGRPVTCRAVIQPLRARRISDSESIGKVGTDRERDGMLYIGPASCRLDQFVRGTTVEEQSGVCYRVISARCVSVGDAPVYVWAVLQEMVTEEA